MTEEENKNANFVFLISPGGSYIVRMDTKTGRSHLLRPTEITWEYIWEYIQEPLDKP